MHVGEPQRHRDLRGTEDPPLAWQVFRAFHRAIHAHRQLMVQIMAERDISPAQALCMRVLGHNDGVSQRDLAEILRVSRPTVTVMVQKMEKAGLVERRVDMADQRYTRIYLTDEGWHAHADMHELLDEFVAETIGPLSEEDQRELERLLGLLNENMNAALEPGAHGCGGFHDAAKDDIL